MKIKYLGVQDYCSTFKEMKKTVLEGLAEDELWILEHFPVYTIGVNKKNIRLPDSNIPIVESDRGGKITYHGPGQLIIYTLINLNRYSLTISKFVRLLEQSIIDFLIPFNIKGERRQDAPGVYIDSKKIASVGLRIKNNQTYHGISINNSMNLHPFLDIDPCGFSDLEMIQLRDLGISLENKELADKIVRIFLKKLRPHETTRN